MLTIIEIKVEKLFDIFDHSIKFHEDGITLMVGENGFGKTVLLKMVEALFNADTKFFDSVIFKRFSIRLSDNREIILRKDTANRVYAKHTKGNLKEIQVQKTSLHEGFEDFFSSEVILIETERLLAENGNKKTIIELSDELMEVIVNKRKESQQIADKLDATYPTRLAGTKDAAKIKSEEFSTELNNLKKKRELLFNVGIIGKEEYQNFQYDWQQDDFMQRVLSVYVEDNKKKLDVFDDLAKKLKVFIELINKRFLYKHVKISKKKGFVFTSKVTGNQIPIEGLSSGEQHKLVLFYTLLFKTEPKTLILIDEPEISLHISWQNCFVDDLRKIVELTSTNILVATHSPNIIGENWEIGLPV